jgi:beta-lactamase regulating signal transducer with metallopeptidase domain
MSEDFAKTALLFAGELFLLSGVVVALAWEAAHLSRSRASLRHLVWLGDFASLLVLPVLALIIPSQIHFALPSLPVPRAIAASPTAAIRPVTAMTDIAPVGAATPPMSHLHIGLDAIASGLIALWLLGVLVIAMRGLAAVYGLCRLKRHSKTCIFSNVTLPGGRYEIRISHRPNDHGPVTWGIFRPVILLPFAAHFWPRERLEAVLMHEVAHIRRRDSLWQLLSMIVCALYWPNPLIWMAARQLRAEAEMAADDTVLDSGFRPSSYAGELLQLASEFRSREPALAGMPLFMAGTALEARVKSVLAPDQKRSGVTKMEVFKICTVALLATAALVFACPTFAQDEPSMPPAVDRTPLPPPAPAAMPAPPPPPAAAANTAAPPSPPPPADAVPPAPPVEAAASSADPDVRVREEDHMVHGHKIRRVWVTVHDPEHVAEEAIKRAQPRIDQAVREIERAQPDIDKAQIEIRAHEAELAAVAAEQPKIQAEVEAALDRVRPDIEKAMTDARLRHLDLKIRENVDRAMKKAEIHIEIERHDAEDSAAGEMPQKRN